MKELGPRIRMIRMRQNRTLQDIADLCGCTRSLISMIECGKSVPALGTIARISKALGITLSEMVSDEAAPKTICTRAESLTEEKKIPLQDGYGFFPLAVSRPGKMMQPSIVVFEGSAEPQEPVTHSGEEFLFILEGHLKYQVGSEVFDLKPGDSLYFDAEIPHRQIPTGETVRLLANFVEPKKNQGFKKGRSVSAQT